MGNGVVSLNVKILDSFIKKVSKEPKKHERDKQLSFLSKIVDDLGEDLNGGFCPEGYVEGKNGFAFFYPQKGSSHGIVSVHYSFSSEEYVIRSFLELP